MTDTTPAIADSDIFISREFNAPRQRVWECWTMPEELAKWFAPEGLTVPLESVELELRVGGPWSLAMAGTDGERYPVRGVITEVIEPELLVVVLDADTADETLEAVTMAVRFHDEGEHTLITMHQGPFTEKQQEDAHAGWKETLDKLDRLLAP